MVVFEDRIDYGPSGLHRVLPREECAIARHGVAQKPFVRGLLAWPLFRQVKLSLLPDEILSRQLDASREGYSRVGREPEANVVGTPVTDPASAKSF